MKIARNIIHPQATPHDAARQGTSVPHTHAGFRAGENITPQKRWKLKNSEKVKRGNALWRERNKEKIQLQNKLYRQRKGKEVQKNYRLRHGQILRDKINKWRRDHRESAAKYARERRKKDVAFRLKGILRHRVWLALKGKIKIGSSIKSLGCSPEELKKWIENQFSRGMSWKNHGDWHVDHKLPLDSFDLTKIKDFERACHYTNLQPLWKIDNLRKSNKVL